MMLDANHKTVFVLDHTQYFGIPSEDLIDLEFFKTKTTGGPTVPPISKSLWTCSLEASVEYCRIVWDLFPTGKLVRFVVSDTAAHIINTWSPNTQNLLHVLNAMSMVGIPPRNSSQTTEFSVIHGLRAAIEALAEPTEQQKELITNKQVDSKKLNNGGRVICITSARDNASMRSLEDIYNTVLLQQNKLSLTRNEFIQIDYCHLIIINLVPVNLESLVTDRAPQHITSVLTSEIHSLSASKISDKLTHLILTHYELASTTVTGIPMKEEQNASSSANYDVEIFHARHAHTVIFGSSMILPTSIKEGSNYETVTLKWCTPRGLGASDLQHCLAQYRVTPVDVTSRPSSCLINFLLNGRSVLLEMPRKAGGKLTSHLLSAHGGEIYIHTLHISRSCLEDLPSISEGEGGRVTDYRITDFGNLMQEHKLFPFKYISEKSYDENLQKARSKLHRRSKYWPLTLGLTIAYNIRQYLDPLLKIICNDTLSDDDILQCHQIIFNIVNLYSRHEQLPLPNMGHRLKGYKKEEQYRLLWSELEILIDYNGSSLGHKAVLQCLRECRIKGSETDLKTDVDQVIRELEPISDSMLRGSVIRAVTDSPMSPPIVIDSSFNKSKKINGTDLNRSLLDILNASERTQHQKRIDLAGRLCTLPGQIARLYPNLGLKESTRDTELK